MSIERQALAEMFAGLNNWLYLLPTDVQRKVRFASVVHYNGGMPSPDAFAREVGGRNWVIARRTKRIVERFGEGVICLSQKQYLAASLAALHREAEAIPPHKHYGDMRTYADGKRHCEFPGCSAAL